MLDRLSTTQKMQVKEDFIKVWHNYIENKEQGRGMAAIELITSQEGDNS